jgi:hypothetical protein
MRAFTRGWTDGVKSAVSSISKYAVMPNAKGAGLERGAWQCRSELVEDGTGDFDAAGVQLLCQRAQV